MSEAFLQLEHVSRFYGNVIGIGDLHLDMEPGAYGLIGPNGAGKTTFLNLIGGMLQPSIGRVRVFGKQPTVDKSVMRRIGLCPATDILYPNISALEWVKNQVSLHGFTGSEAEQRAEASLTELGLWESMRSPIGSYSLGMRQRTKLAQAMAHSPDLLILDEPFNGLDPIGRHELSELVKRWIDDGKNLILASHVLHEVEMITNNFLLIHGGRLLASGNASEVRGMLRGFPIEVTLRGKGLEHVAQAAGKEEWLTGLQFEDGREALRLEVSDQQSFQPFLSRIALEPSVEIHEIGSPSGSLEDAFDLLLRAHRGEI